MSGSLDVLVFGSAIMDFICYTPRLPKAGETLHGQKFETGFGGKGANQCVAAARLGSRTSLIAKLGDDYFGSEYLFQLRTEKVNIDYVEQKRGEKTGIAQIAVSNTGENNIIIVVGANNSLSVSDVAKAAELFEQAKVLLCQLETPVDATLEALRQFKGISILNAAPAMEQTPPELLHLASILCVNETEAALMIKVEAIKCLSDAHMALIRLIEMGANTVIITLGSLGAVYATKDSDLSCNIVPAPIVPPELVLDTTGSGDAFIGALAHSLARHTEFSMRTHIEFACKMASKSVQKLGTQSSFPYN